MAELYNEEKPDEELSVALNPSLPSEPINKTISSPAFGPEIFGDIVFRGGGLESSNFVAGSAGWAIEGDGDTEFNNGIFRGTITATAGAIGGFDIGSDYIRDVANSFGLASTVTAGDDVRFWAGDTFANRATAPFRVTEAGVITATSGTVGGWTLASTTLTGGNVILDQANNKITVGAGANMITLNGATGVISSASGTLSMSGSGVVTGFSTIKVSQTAHGFSVGNAIKCTGANTYAKAQADSAANAEVVGIVSTVTDANNFIFTMSGKITSGVPAQAAGTVMFLDPSTAGALTTTEPSTVGQVSKPLVVIIENATSMIFINYRGIVI